MTTEEDDLDPQDCAVCGRKRRGHGNVYTRPVGGHHWTPPDDAIVLARMKKRRGDQ